MRGVVSVAWDDRQRHRHRVGGVGRLSQLGVDDNVGGLRDAVVGLGRKDQVVTDGAAIAVAVVALDERPHWVRSSWVSSVTFASRPSTGAKIESE